MFAIPRFPEAALGKLPRKNSIEDTRAFLKKMGDPDLGMKIIHVAGTNGKGSVCAYIRSILESAGKKVCLFTSPHLVEVTERFYICGRDVSKDAFLQAFLTVYEMLDWEKLEKGEGFHPSFFEFLFFMAMQLFKEAEPDYCILETGLGGRLDATNSVRNKEIAVITSISKDHMEYLGDTVEKIAEEKAGIMMPGVPTVAVHREESVSQVFCRIAKKYENPLYLVSKDQAQSVKKANKTIDFSISTDYYESIDVTLHGEALYQIENCLAAVKAVEVLDRGREFSAGIVRRGLADCHWQGRMEEVLPRVFVDGAHNRDGVRAFLETVAQDDWDGTRSLLVSVVKDKEYSEMFHAMLSSGLFHKVYTAPLGSGRTLSETDLQKVVKEALGAEHKGITLGQFSNVASAMKSLLAEKSDTERIYVAGSLYLVGEVKAYLREQKI